MTSRRLGLDNRAPRLLRTVRGKTHARAEDHEDLTPPTPKRQCRQGEKQAEGISSGPIGLNGVSESGLERERVSASPISLDSDEGNRKEATRTDEKQRSSDDSRLAKSNVKKGPGRKTYRSNARSAVRNASSTHDPQPDNDPAGFPSSSGTRAGGVTKKYSGKKYTKNVHVGLRPEPNDVTPQKLQEEVGKKLDSGFFAPPSIPLQRLRDGESNFKSPDKNAAREEDDTSSNSSFENDSELPNDLLFKQANGPSSQSQKRSKKAGLKKYLPVGNGFRNPSDYALRSSNRSLDPSSDFKVPVSPVDGSGSSLSSPPDSDILDYAEETLDLPPTSSQTVYDSQYAVCPACNEPVDRSFLDEFSNYARRMSVRKQALFCHAHKRRSAKEEYHDAGYPDIDWNALPKRLKGHHRYIEEILDRRKQSWYRNKLEERAKSGKQRTLHQTATATDDESAMHKFVPGYYGSKGARFM